MVLPSGLENVTKVHWLNGRVRLYDCTKNGVVSTIDVEGHKFCVFTIRKCWDGENGKLEFRDDTLPVFFEGAGPEPFSSENQTNYVTVNDSAYGLKEIVEHKFPKSRGGPEEIRRWLTAGQIQGCYGIGYRFLAELQGTKKVAKKDECCNSAFASKAFTKACQEVHGNRIWIMI